MGRPRKESADSTKGADATAKKPQPPKASQPRTEKRPPPPNLKIPDYDEWEDFVGNYVLRWASRAFIAVMFRGIDRERMLTPDELEDIELDDEQLTALSRPFAKMATASAFNTKYGRVVMNSKDSIEAFVVMFMWGNRVRAISKRYRPRHARKGTDIDARNDSSRITISEQAPSPAQGQPIYNGNGTRPHGVGYN